MDKQELEDFYINAAVSSKSKKSPGILLIAACAEIFLFGTMSIHTSNTCESKKIIIGRANSRSMAKEYQNLFLDARQKIEVSKNDNNKAVVDKMEWFIDTLEKFMTKLDDFLVENEDRRSGLTRVIYPSKSGGMLEDLKENLIGKMKPFALPFSGKDDNDHVDLVTDDKGMNVAKLNGAEPLRYKNGSGLVSWMPKGTQLPTLAKNLNSLLGYISNDFIAYGEYFFPYVLQAFMNIIFVNNPRLSELDRIRILSNYEMLLKNISDKNIHQFESYERATDEKQKKEELKKPTRFIKFLLNQICKGTSLQNLDLSTEENKTKYIGSITTITSLLCNAEHANQVLVEQWHFTRGVLTMGNAFCGKNNVLYLPLYEILQRFISLNLFKFENNDEKTEFERMLHFMVNLSGKFRFKKTKFDLSSTQTQDEYKFGAQITTKGKYKVSTEYETDISFDYFQKLTQEIIKFEEFEGKIRKADYKFSDNDISDIIKYLLDGRSFYNDVVEKILKDTEFSKKLIEKAKKSKIDDKGCCYESAYAILVNDYFDLLNQHNCIDKNLLTHANLIKYFNNGKHTDEITDLDAELVVELELFDRLDAKTINGFLGDKSRQSKMLQILKLVIGELKKEKLNELNFDNFDSELLNAVVLSRFSDISKDKIGKIRFGKLNADAQKFLFKKMADDDFKNFNFEINLKEVNLEIFKSATIGEWRKFVFKLIPDDGKLAKKNVDIFKQRSDILKLMPVNILSLFDTRKVSLSDPNGYTFFNFFDDCFDCWSVEQILTFGRCRRYSSIKSKENKLEDYSHRSGYRVEDDKNEFKDELKKLKQADLNELESKIKKNGIKLKENSLITFLSLQDLFQQIDENRYDNKWQNKWAPEGILFDFFKKNLLGDNNKNKGNISECLEYVFSGCENNCFSAMIIMEAFILLDKEIINKNKAGNCYIMVDSSELRDDDLLKISKEIKSALNWENVVERKKIIKNLFSSVPKINELMRECDKIAGGDESNRLPFRFMTLLNIYKSFLNKILLLYPDDIDKDDVKKIPVCFLDNKEVIKLFCRMCGDRVGIDCFSEIIDSANQVKDIGHFNAEEPAEVYKFKKVSGIFKILDVVDSIEEIEREIRDLDPDSEKADFMMDIQTKALLICFGYHENQPGNSVETHLSRYAENGRFNYDHSKSVLFDMFDSLCNQKTAVDDYFIKKYNHELNKEQKNQLEQIIMSKNNTDNFGDFEDFILPLIEKDYKNMDFVAFVQRYDLLENAIGVENIDKRMINIACDFVRGQMSFEEFIYKYYVLPNNENKIIENKIVDSKIDDYHIEELKDKASQDILTKILINNGNAEEIIKNADEKTIKKLYENLLPKNKNIAKEKKLPDMRDSVKKYLNNIQLCKSSYGKFSGDTVKLANILFNERENNAEVKAKKFSTMIDTYTKKNRDNWDDFSEIYFLQHISLKNMQRYMELRPTYQKILDLNTKAENLENVMKACYGEINNIKGCIEVINKCYENINNSSLGEQFLWSIQEKVMASDFVDNCKTLLNNLIEISNMYAIDEAVEICKKYEYLVQDKSGSSIKKFFSSTVNCVHFINDYRKLDKILAIGDYSEYVGNESQVKTKEEEIAAIAYDILDYHVLRETELGDFFAFEFVHCLDELKEVLNLPYQKYKETKKKEIKEISEDEYKQKQELLKQIYDKYEEYGKRFLSSRVEVMCQERDGISDFEADLKSVMETLNNIGFAKENRVFKSCVDAFKHNVLAKYKKKLGFETGTNLQKFVDLGYQKYFSDKQIYDIGIKNVFDCDGKYTRESVIKKLPKIVCGTSTKELDEASEKLSLRPDDHKLDYILASVNSGGTCTDTMSQLFWHMDYRKSKTFVSGYSFKDFKDMNKSNDRSIAKFGVHLQNALIGAFGYKFKEIKNSNEKNSLIEYNKMTVSQKFIFGECFFGSMLRSICQVNKFKKEKETNNQDEYRVYHRDDYYNNKIYDIDAKKEFDELVNMIKSRVSSICTNPPTKQNSKNNLDLIKAMPDKTLFDSSLEELIARAFLSAHIYAYSGHIDGNGHDKSLLDLGNDFFDKVISMLSRSTERNKFQNADDIKKLVDESSLKYFIRGTFNFNEIPENELSSHQMELEQNGLIAKYNIRILNHMLSKTGDQVSVFDVFKQIYLDNGNKVIYEFDLEELVDLLREKVVTTTKNKEDFLTLLKFLKKVDILCMPDAVCDKFFNCLLECAKNANLLDENKKFVNKEALTWWIENVVLVFAVDARIENKFRKKILMYMADNIGKNISVMDVIDILKTTDEENPGSYLAPALRWVCDSDFVNNLFGQKETQFISAENSKNLDKGKLEDVFYFLDKIGPFCWFDLLNLFPLLDIMNEKEKLISTDIPNGTKKFINEDSLQNFFGYEIMDDAGNKDKRMVIDLWKFLYAISRIPQDKTLLDVVKKFEENKENGEKKIFINQWEYTPEVFKSAVQAMHDCLSKEKNNINGKNKSDYIKFLIRFFTNIKPWKEIDQNVSEMIGDMFNLFQSQELLKHMDNIRAAFLKNKSKTPILYSIFCKSIENMGNDDITNGNLLKVLEMLESLENISESDFNQLKNVLNEKIKTVMPNNEDPKKMANDILSIVSAKKISSLLDLSPCLDALNSENLFALQNHPITNFIKNGVSKDNKDCDNKWIRFKCAMQQIPKNITVVNVLQEIKQNHADVWNFNFPELPGNLYASDFCKDICSRIQEESNSMPQDNQKLFETVDILIEFFKKITLLDKENSRIKDCFKKNWDDIVKNKNANEESFIVCSIIETLKILLSKYKFNNANDITVFFSEIKKILKELELDSGKNVNIDIFIPTVSSALDNSNLNIFLLLKYLKKQKKNDDICMRVLQNKDILNKLLDMFKQQIEKLEKEEIANVEFPKDIGNNYKNSGIIFLVQQFMIHGDINDFQNVVYPALRICRCNITEDRAHIKKCKIISNKKDYSDEQMKKGQMVSVDDWLYVFFHIFEYTSKELIGYRLGILQKMALEYLIDNLGKDIKIFNVLNALIDKTKYIPQRCKIGANKKIDEFTTLSEKMSKILVNKILSEKFPEEEEEDEEEGEIKSFEADKKIRFVSKFVQLMRFKIDANEEKRLFDTLKQQKKEQKLEYEEAEKKKREEKQKKKDESKKRQEEQKQLNEKNTIDDKQSNKNNSEKDNSGDKENIKINIEPKKNATEEQKGEEEQNKQNEINTIDSKLNNKNDNKKHNLEDKTNQQGNITNNIINEGHHTGNDKNETTIKIPLISQRPIEKPVENPTNKKNILIKFLAWFLSLCLVLICIYFFIQSVIMNTIITLVLAIIFTVVSILLTIYLPNKKEQNINKIKMPFNEENSIIYNNFDKYPNQQRQGIERNKQE